MDQKLDHELVHSGHVACPGCGAVLAMRYVLNVLGPKTILVLPACCWSVITNRFPSCSVKIPVFHTAFETAACVASGVRAGLDMKGDRDTNVLAWAGDGGTFDIGLQALSGAAERNDDFIFVCYDNEAYMNTGIQRSSATPFGAWTTTTPKENFKHQEKKNIMGIMAAHKVPYAATASVAFPEDLMAKVARARDLRGTRFLHILCPCPTGWKYSSDMTVGLGRAAVNSRIFPLYEIMDGERFRLSYDPEEPMPAADYIKMQNRFSHLNPEEIVAVQQRTDRDWERLMHTIRSWPA
ncbi:MAG: thiamine pyrophosphate-dependent enzyme [bacterium]